MNKARITSVLASIILGATILVGCPQPIIEPETEPETTYITAEEKDVIDNLSTETFEKSVESIKKIIAILDNHSDKLNVSNYKNVISKIANANLSEISEP